jgi:hypothetical protein
MIFWGASAPYLTAGDEVDARSLAASAFRIFSGASDARPVRAGEWVEYLISFPTDPLEDSLRPAPPAANDGAWRGPDEDSFFFPDIEPLFEPEITWRSLPLRLEIRAVEPNGCAVTMSFGPRREEVFLPLEQQFGVPLYYNEPQPATVMDQYVVGDLVFSVETVQRNAPGIGFIRIGSPDLPFGLARFATENVDIALIGMGDSGDMPPFPLENPAGLSPAPGALYRSAE